MTLPNQTIRHTSCHIIISKTVHSGQCLPCDEYRYDALVYVDDVMVSTIENHCLPVLVVKRAE